MLPNQDDSIRSGGAPTRLLLGVETLDPRVFEFDFQRNLQRCVTLHDFPVASTVRALFGFELLQHLIQRAPVVHFSVADDRVDLTRIPDVL